MGIFEEEKHLDLFDSLRNEGFDLEEILLHLPQGGASPAQCCSIIRRKLNLSLPKADELILNSRTFSDIKDATMQLRDVWD